MAKSQKKYGSRSTKRRRSRNRSRVGKRVSRSFSRAVQKVVKTSAGERLRSITVLDHGTTFGWSTNVSSAVSYGIGQGWANVLGGLRQFSTSTGNPRVQGIIGRQVLIDQITISYQFAWTVSLKKPVQNGRFFLFGARSKGAYELIEDFGDLSQTFYNPTNGDAMMRNTLVQHPRCSILAMRKIRLVSGDKYSGTAPTQMQQDFAFTIRFKRPWIVTYRLGANDFSVFENIQKGALACMYLFEDGTIYTADNDTRLPLVDIKYRDI